MAELSGFLLLGLFYGLTVCSLSCLPYLAPVMLGSGRGFKEGLHGGLLFGSGKMLSYGFLGGIAAFSGQLATSLPAGPRKIVTGMILIGVGLLIPVMARKKAGAAPCRTVHHGLPPFVLGLATSLIPCPPLAALFVLAAEQSSWLTGMGYGLSYGLGLMLSPLILISGALSLIGRKFQEEARGLVPYLRGITTIFMVLLGIRAMV